MCLTRSIMLRNWFSMKLNMHGSSFPQMLVTIGRWQGITSEIGKKMTGFFSMHGQFLCPAQSGRNNKPEGELNSFSFFSHAWSVQSLPRETMWTPIFFVFRPLSFLLPHFGPPQFSFFFCLFIFILNSTALNNRRSPVKKAWF